MWTVSLYYDKVFVSFITFFFGSANQPKVIFVLHIEYRIIDIMLQIKYIAVLI